MISGVESLWLNDDEDDDDISDLASDEFSGSSLTNVATDTSTVSVAFHCYHSLSSAQRSHHVDVCTQLNHVDIVISRSVEQH